MTATRSSIAHRGCWRLSGGFPHPYRYLSDDTTIGRSDAIVNVGSSRLHLRCSGWTGVGLVEVGSVTMNRVPPSVCLSYRMLP